MEGDITVKIDYDLCMGDCNCNTVCPEAFDHNEGRLLSKVRVETVPANLEQKVRRSEAEWAPGAIVIEQ